MPVLLTSTSSRPKAARVACTAACRCCGSSPEPAAKIARSGPPSSATASSSAGCLRAVMQTRAPSATSRCATARPMPRLAPVTSATCPSKRPSRHGRLLSPVADCPVRRVGGRLSRPAGRPPRAGRPAAGPDAGWTAPSTAREPLVQLAGRSGQSGRERLGRLRIGRRPQHQLHARPDPGPDVGEGQRIAVPADQPAQLGGGEVDRLLDVGHRHAALAGPQGAALHRDAARGQPPDEQQAGRQQQRERQPGDPAGDRHRELQAEQHRHPHRGQVPPPRRPQPLEVARAGPAGLAREVRGGHHRTRVAFGRCDDRSAERAQPARTHRTPALARCRLTGAGAAAAPGRAAAPLRAGRRRRRRPVHHGRRPAAARRARPAADRPGDRAARRVRRIRPAPVRAGLAGGPGHGQRAGNDRFGLPWRDQSHRRQPRSRPGRRVAPWRPDRPAGHPAGRAGPVRGGGTAARLCPRRCRARLDRGSRGAGRPADLPVANNRGDDQ